MEFQQTEHTQTVQHALTFKCKKGHPMIYAKKHPEGYEEYQCHKCDKKKNSSDGLWYCKKSECEVDDEFLYSTCCDCSRKPNAGALANLKKVMQDFSNAAEFCQDNFTDTVQFTRDVRTLLDKNNHVKHMNIADLNAGDAKYIGLTVNSGAVLTADEIKNGASSQINLQGDQDEEVRLSSYKSCIFFHQYMLESGRPCSMIAQNGADPNKDVVLQNIIFQLKNHPKAKTLTLHYNGHGMVSNNGNKFCGAWKCKDMQTILIENIMKTVNENTQTPNIKLVVIADTCGAGGALDRVKHLKYGHTKYPNIKRVNFIFACYALEVSKGNHNGGLFTFDYLIKGEDDVVDYILNEKVTFDGLQYSANYAKQEYRQKHTFKEDKK